MENKKELYNLLAEHHNVYLPFYQLEQAYTMLKELTKTEGYFKAIDLVENAYNDKKQYNDPSKGAYVLENKHYEYVKGLGKKIIAIDKQTGDEFEYDSIYQASLDIVGDKSGVGNISQAVNGKKKSVYGYIFKSI